MPQTQSEWWELRILGECKDIWPVDEKGARKGKVNISQKQSIGMGVENVG